MKRTNGNGYDWYPIVKACSFVALIIAAILIFVCNLLPLVKVKVDWPGWGYLNLIKEIALLIGIGFGAFAFTRGKKIWVAVVFWIALVLYIASVILGIF